MTASYAFLEDTMRKITPKNRLRYHFDNMMSKGPIAIIIWLFVLSVILILAVSTVVFVSKIAPDEQGFLEIAWMGLMRTLDAGTMGGDAGNWPFLLSMFVITLGGVFVVSTLIGVLTSGIEEKLGELRKGRSFVAEEGHTVILGWSDQVFTVVSELAVANENKKRACIAILAEKDKVEMEDEITDKVPDTKTTRVVCRTGNPMDMTDLEIINPHAARSIVILAPEGTDDPDVRVIKTILAVTNSPNRKPALYHIVAALSDPKNMNVARMVGKDEVELILSGDLIARITAQTCRQSGLSVAYTDLLDFGGDEIYFKEEPPLVGKAFGEALTAYEDSAVMGLAAADGTIRVKPPMDTKIREGDQVIAISEDDDTIRLSGKADLSIDDAAIRNPKPPAPRPEQTLIIGWNRRALTIIRELDGYVAPGSKVAVFTRADAVDSDDLKKQVVDLGLNNSSVSLSTGDTADRRSIDALDLYSYDHVIVLSYSDTLTTEGADAYTLVTLLHLRDIEDKTGRLLNIVSEMLDVRNRDLAEVTKADDFIVSNRLVSLILTQISENKRLAPVFADLFDPEGAEIYIKPAELYVQIGKPVNFYTVVESARRKDEVAIGYRVASHAHDAAHAYGVVINPDKSNLITFSPKDRIIVLAEG
jgi:voltage-gated potassium channel Kch